MAIFATDLTATLSPRERTFAQLVGMVSESLTGEAKVTSVAIVRMILETVEKNMQEVLSEAMDGVPLDVVCKDLEDYAKHRAEYEVADCGFNILYGVEDAFRKAWEGA